jgi:hypothetical protein
VIPPHDSAFRYRRHMLVVVLATAIAVALVDPGSDRADKLPDALSICVVSVLGYGAMRALVWIAARPLTPKWPHVVCVWGLICFYGLIPLSLFGLYFGSWESHAPTPSPTTVAFVVAGATSVAAGAFAAIQATAGRLTIGWSGP